MKTSTLPRPTRSTPGAGRRSGYERGKVVSVVAAARI